MANTDYSKLFNENMSSFEARTVLYTAVDGLSKDEKKKLCEAYKK